MPRYRLLVEYDGRPYRGYQAQGDLPSVQSSIERAIKAFCGQDLRLQAAGRTDTGVHATGRRYLYRILARRSPPALEKGRVWHFRKPLDAEAMHQAAQILVGHHDFTTFRDLQCQAKSAMKTLDEVRVWREGDQVLLVFASRSFLHRQVRSMTGSLAEVGVGRWSAGDLRAALGARDRRACGPVAPADGLYLTGVDYAPAKVEAPEEE